MVVVPEFRGNKHLFSLNLPLLEHLLHGFAYRFFISVSFCGIELAKSCFQRDRGRVFGIDGVGNQRAKTECGDRAGSIYEGYLRIAKVVAFYRFHIIGLSFVLLTFVVLVSPIRGEAIVVQLVICLNIVVSGDPAAVARALVMCCAFSEIMLRFTAN